MTLLEEIQNGENVALEFKEARPKDSLKFTKTVVAFANGKGGRIIFGIEDGTHNIVGVPRDRVFSEMDAIVNVIVDYSDIVKEESWDNDFKTIHIKNEDKFVKELLRAMFYTDRTTFIAMYKVIGNAVPPRAGYVVALPLLMAAFEQSCSDDVQDVVSIDAVSKDYELILDSSTLS